MAELTELDWACIEAFADNDMNASRTAKALYRTRNDFLYHLKKIREKTGLDPQRFNDLMRLIQVGRMKTMLVVTCEVDAPPGLALAVKENLAMLLERYGDTKVVSVEVKE